MEEICEGQGWPGMSPFKSEAQRAKFMELLSQGKITKAEFDRLVRETGSQKLPERLHPPREKKPHHTLPKYPPLKPKN